MELQTCSFITMKFASSTMWLLSFRRSCTRGTVGFLLDVLIDKVCFGKKERMLLLITDRYSNSRG
ncbi:hypothetical protein SOVF_041330 isoform A [Spinacia oleracea]|nr:hypothetical protein SOVF_041330 isoform A [Spinacia oleracea]